jgi:lipopolysaccharide transport system ATP-binding protein
LLKILSRVTAPTSGEVNVKGRIASLLEVGTGFHPELTGRENIFLNGAILGMKKVEIARKLDEIVDFSEVSKYIDTPVKRYSSGMYVRLAFAVAAHLDPEILIVDEVLAVGDASFQKKCLGKMQEVAGQGRTVFFVSHNMIAVQSLCSRCILLDSGTIRCDDVASQAIALYVQGSLQSGSERVWQDKSIAPGNDVVRIASVAVKASADRLGAHIAMATPFTIETEYWVRKAHAVVAITYHLFNDQGLVAFTTGSESLKADIGRYRSVCRVPGGLLNSGSHYLKLLIVEDGSRVTYRMDDVASFQVVDIQKRKDGWMGREPGIVHPILEWETRRLPQS